MSPRRSARRSSRRTAREGARDLAGVPIGARPDRARQRAAALGCTPPPEIEAVDADLRSEEQVRHRPSSRQKAKAEKNLSRRDGGQLKTATRTRRRTAGPPFNRVRARAVRPQESQGGDLPRHAAQGECGCRFAETSGMGGGRTEAEL